MRFILQSPARLHATLLDLNGSLGRVDGGFGFGLNSPAFRLEFSDEANQVSEFGQYPNADRLFREVRTAIEREFNLPKKPMRVQILQEIPPHIGLGSKTQILLSFAQGICKIHGISPSISHLTKLVGRGGTSGVGYQVFDHGGFNLDLGHSFGPDGEKHAMRPSSNSVAQPALPFYHMPFPEKWKFILIKPNVPPGASNSEEIDIFDQYTPVPKHEVEQISHRLLFELIPSILQQDLSRFATALQFINHHGFKRVEIALQHPIISELIEYIHSKHQIPVGMSSFGPTLFCITPKEMPLSKLKTSVVKYAQRVENSPPLEFYESFPNNTGHLIKHIT